MLQLPPLALSALTGAALPLALLGGELALARVLPPGAPLRARQRARMRCWLLLAVCWALGAMGLFVWSDLIQVYGEPARQITFAVWAVASGVLAQRAYWLVYRSEWIRLPSGRPPSALGRLVLLLLCEALAVTIFAEDMRAWLSPSPVTAVLQRVGGAASEALLAIFIAMLLLGMLGRLSERELPWE